MFRCNLNNHLQNTCPNRQYQCPHCKDTGRHCEITTIHLVTCPKLKISCPNVGCDDSVPRCELSDHQTKCLFEKVPCRYAHIGCEEEPLHKDLQQHENDDTFHLHLAIETVSRQQKEMKGMKEEQRAMKEEQRVMKEEQRAMKEEQRAMKDEQKSMKRDMQAEIAHTQASPCVFKMPNFNQQKTSNQEWYSPPFYIHPGSYKMCIRVDANGNKQGKGTHVSVYAYLMRGKNDDNLSWPFRGEVTFTLLNQLKDKHHFTYTLVYPEDKDDEGNRRVVDRDMVPTGYGWARFIPHYQLDYYVLYNCQYLKDDCLYFRITANPPWLTCTT